MIFAILNSLIDIFGSSTAISRNASLPMIVRQFCARHGKRVCNAVLCICADNSIGRSPLSNSASRNLFRSFASEADNPPSARPRLSRGLSPHETASDAGRSVRSHDPTSSILDAIPEAPTPRTSQLEERLDSTIENTKSIQAEINAHISSRILSLPDELASALSPGDASLIPRTPKDLRKKAPTPQPGTTLPPPPFPNLSALYRHRKSERRLSRVGTNVSSKPAYDSLAHLNDPPTSDELTLPMLLTAQSHLGHATSLWNPRNSSYIFGIRDGIHIISLDTTYACLRRAAKVVTEVARRGGIILFVGTRDGQEDVVVKAAKLAKGYHIFDRWTPGSLTNGQQILGRCKVKVVDIQDRELEQYKTLMEQSAASGSHPVMRPDLVVCLNPLENEVCLHECGLYNVPTVGIIDTDADPSWVTYPIPANDDSLRCVMLVAGVLGRAGEEGQRQRLEEARLHGRPTYSTTKADVFLDGLEELKGMDVQDNSGPTT